MGTTNHNKFIAFNVIIMLIVSLFLAACAPADDANRDLSTMYGVPELYNLQWDTSVDEADSLIKAKHVNILDEIISLTETYKIGGLTCDTVMCSFTNGKLDAVIFAFLKDEVSFDDVANVWINIYGEPHHSMDNYIEWEGTETQIDIWDDEAIYNREPEIVVRYLKEKGTMPTEAAQSTEGILPTRQDITFETIDPLGYLNEPQLIGSDINDYIGDKVEGKDFEKEEYIIEFEELKDSSFVSYRFPQDFEYIDGAETGSTAVEITTPYGSDIVDTFKYAFIWNPEGVDTLVEAIKARYDFLQSECGAYSSCIYTSLYLTGAGAQDISFDDMCRGIAEKQQGIYSLQWKYGEINITLSITIDDRDDSVEGSMTFA